VENWATADTGSWITVTVTQLGRQDGYYLNDAYYPYSARERDSILAGDRKDMRAMPTSCGTVEDVPTDPGVVSFCSHPTVQLTTCHERIAGQVVWVAAGRATGYGHGRFVSWAHWDLGDDRWVGLSLSGTSRLAQEEHLALLRTVHLH
jgi:hypothetical protein